MSVFIPGWDLPEAIARRRRCQLNMSQLVAGRWNAGDMMMTDPGIKPFTGRVTRPTEAPPIAADMFSPAQIAGLEPDALANINGPSILRMPDWAAGRRGCARTAARRERRG